MIDFWAEEPGIRLSVEAWGKGVRLTIHTSDDRQQMVASIAEWRWNFILAHLRTESRTRMKLTLQPTGDYFMAGNQKVQQWSGTDEEGRPVVAYIAGVGLSDGSPRPPIMSVPLIPTSAPD